MKSFKKITLSIAFGFVLATSAFGTVEPREKITIVADKSMQQDAGFMLAIEDVAEAVHSTGREVLTILLPDGVPIPGGNIIRVSQKTLIPAQSPLQHDGSSKTWVGAKSEGYRLNPEFYTLRQAKPEGYIIKTIPPLGNHRILFVQGDRQGLKYGLFKLAERIRLGNELWKIELESAPAFSLRLFSEEGQLLDIPDIGYYSNSPPYINEQMLQQEIDEEKQLIKHIVKLGFNAFSILNLGVEEYIDYRYLDKKVYADDDRHRVRSPIFCKYLTELCDYAHSLGVDIYMQVYEIQFPQKLDELYGVDLDSPNIEQIINARYKELFERVPLDGMIITATEVHPRAGYRGKMLWRQKGRIGAGQMLTMYHNACKATGKKSIFRMWRIANDANSVKEVTQFVPKDATLAIKNSGGDYYLNKSITTAITSGIAHKQPMVVLFDTFREFDGWSRLFIYMKRWGPMLQACRDNGVAGIIGWGPWAPGCIWPDNEPDYLRPQGPPVSWRGKWNSFRMFTRGFTPGQANVYLLARLTWNPDDDVKQIAEDFAALHLGRANAADAAEALLATEDAFAEEYVEGTAHPCYIKWTIVFNPRPEDMEKAYLENPLPVILASNSRALKKVGQMEQAFAKTCAAKAPNEKVYAAFKEGIDKTALYLRTFYLWRQCWWRNRADQDLTGAQKAENAISLYTDKSQLMPLFDQWSKYPEEAGHWRITLRYGQPNLSADGVFPYWYPHGDISMEKSAESFKQIYNHNPIPLKK